VIECDNVNCKNPLRVSQSLDGRALIGCGQGVEWHGKLFCSEACRDTYIFSHDREQE
jgi:hypothetical protein